MLSRQERRKIERKMKKSLTEQQFNELKHEAIEETAHYKAGQMFKDFSKALLETMRENRISEKRVKKIFDEAFEKLLKEKS